MADHVYELVLPFGEREVIGLPVGSMICFKNPGESEPFCVVTRTARGKTRIEFRADDERFTVADYELMTEVPMPPALIRIGP